MSPSSGNRTFVASLDLGQTQDPSALVIDHLQGDGAPWMHVIRFAH